MNDFAGHGVGQRNIAAHVESQPNVSPLRSDSTARVDDDQPRPIANRFENVVEEDRMRFARIGSPQNDQVGLFDFLVRSCAATRSEDRRQTGDAGSVSGAVTAIDVVAADNDAGKLLAQEIQFVGCLGAAEEGRLPLLPRRSRRPPASVLLPRSRSASVRRHAPSVR